MIGRMIGIMFGVIIGFILANLSKGITLSIYNYFGIVKPVCDVGFSCGWSAMFDYSLYLLAVFGVCVVAWLSGYLLAPPKKKRKNKVFYWNG